mmetsp:Transcript_14809/g.16513  ORF Transcript_14809/g.16513 Transcript_14809/m.16513 type:complete len:80 (+) Transcript_14809:27-266(+)
MSRCGKIWGPKYNGFLGFVKKSSELLVHPGMWPFTVGGLCGAVLLGNLPISKQQYEESVFLHNDKFMEERKRLTGHYAH